jgi:secondary thiamine-phosphate synthase enzyme
MLFQDSIQVETPGRGTHELTALVDRRLAAAGVGEGLCTLFVHHTSASLVVCENADPDVRRDLEAWLSRAVPDGDALYRHTCEGPDDMPAHVRSALTATSLSIPVRGGRLDLGTWQGVYLYEHRHRGHRRRVSLTVVG